MNYFICCSLICILCIHLSYSDKFVEEISNVVWHCADINCTAPLSIATPKSNFPSNHNLKVSFQLKNEVKILGKPVDQTVEYFLVSVNEKLGIAPKKLLKEIEIRINTKDCVTTKYDFSFLSPKKTKASIKPSPTTKIVDGTPLPYDEEILGDSGYIEDNIDEDVTVTTVDSTEELEETPLTANNEESNRVATSNSEEERGGVEASSVEQLTENAENVEAEGEQGTAENVAQLSPLEPQSAASTHNTSLPQIQQPNVLLMSDSDSAVTEASAPTDLSATEAAAPSDLSASEALAPNDPSASEASAPSDPSAKQAAASSDPSFTEASAPSDPSAKQAAAPSDPSATEAFAPSDPSTSEASASSDLSASEASASNGPSATEATAPSDKSVKQAAAPSDLSASEASAPSDPNASEAAAPSYLSASEASALSDPSATEASAPSDESASEATAPIVPDRKSPEGDPGTVETKILSNVNPPLDNTLTHPLNSEDNTESTSTHSNIVSEISFGSVENLEQESLVNISFEKSESAVDISNQTLEPGIAGTNEALQTETKQPVESFTAPQVAKHPDEVAEAKFYSPYEALRSAYKSTPAPEIPSESQPGTESSLPQVTGEGTYDGRNVPSLEESTTDPSPEPQLPFTLTSQTDTAEGSEAETLKHSLYEGYSTSEMPPTEEPTFHVDTLESSDSPTENTFEESDTNWFSPVSSVLNSVVEMFSTSPMSESHQFEEEPLPETSQLSDGHTPSSSQPEVGFCERERCTAPPDIPVTPSPQDNFQLLSVEVAEVSGVTLLYVILSTSAVLLFSLGYYYLENVKQEAKLVAKINSLSAELFFAQKELSTIEEQMSVTSENVQKMETNKYCDREELRQLKQDLEDAEGEKERLEREVKRLEKEVEELVESNDEMHRMLTESISEEDRAQSLLVNIADLKTELSSRLDEISSLTHQLDLEKQQVELLSIALQKSEEQKENSEEQLSKVMNEIDSKALSVAKEFEEKISSLEKIIEESSLERTNFEKELCEVKAECERLLVEKELTEKELKRAQGVGPGKALQEWLDAKEVRADLLTAHKEIEKLKRQLEEAKDHESKLASQKTDLQKEIETLNNNYETAEKEKIDALTRLQVLSNYFKEKEIQLQEELGEREAQWLQKQSEDDTIYEQMRTLREENLSYKAQNEALKREILDQEASFKVQIANEEQKAQEHWVTLRHTERRLKEVQMEAAHLRSRLTALEATNESLEEKHKSLELVNGEVGMSAGSPPFMLYHPPPPPDFIPPPPLISPSRPPPLGRLSSPPLTPPPPLSPYELPLYPPPPPPTASPPPPHRGIHKPQPRESTIHRKQKDSQSSNHSSESTERAGRRGKR